MKPLIESEEAVHDMFLVPVPDPGRVLILHLTNRLSAEAQFELLDLIEEGRLTVSRNRTTKLVISGHGDAVADRVRDLLSP